MSTGIFSATSVCAEGQKQTLTLWPAGIFYYKFSDEGKVKDIYFLRQPSRDEMARKFVNPPDYHMFKFDPKDFAGRPARPLLWVRTPVSRCFCCDVPQAGQVHILHVVNHIHQDGTSTARVPTPHF